ncbi:MAG TPA: HAMP domain-containing sensor histidine kinase [Nocardioidaceae bacterium]|nr:HAMP domain-containing sensor histidine kinase [Nocardioidaceae bacterium]
MSQKRQIGQFIASGSSTGRMTLARRVTLLTSVAVGVAVAATSLAAFFTMRHQLLNSVDQSLISRAHTAVEARGYSWQNDASTGLLGAANICAEVRAPNGAVVEAVPDDCDLDSGAPEAAVATGARDEVLRTVGSDAGNYRIATVPLPDGGAFSLAQSLAPTESVLTKLSWITLAVGGIGVLVAGLAGMAVARSGLRPVRRLTARAEEIARTGQLHPIEVTGDDEVARLASAFNGMLAALFASRERQRRLIADAGHELRTPLTSMRTNLDLLAQADQRGGMDPTQRAELLTDVRAQAAELTTLVQDVVELARDDAITRDPELLDLAEVVDRAVERVRRRAGAVRFDVRTQPWMVVGEPQALERAVLNLLDNAVKWSPDGGAVTVRLAEGMLDVYDEGPGIPEEHQPHVFERFYRADDARGMSGSGLGLAIVRQAAERHGGSVLAGTAPGGGAAFRLLIPAAPESWSPPSQVSAASQVDPEHLRT